MKLLITLKEIEDLSSHLPAFVNPENLEWNRLVEINEPPNNKGISAEVSILRKACIYEQLSFDLQCLYKTFEVTVHPKIDAETFIDYWEQHQAVLLVDVIE